VGSSRYRDVGRTDVDRRLRGDSVRAPAIDEFRRSMDAGELADRSVRPVVHRLWTGPRAALLRVRHLGNRTPQEDVGGITFTADATNGYFTVRSAHTYATRG
jgi:hypothetical protein